jgi:hypothetical protein
MKTITIVSAAMFASAALVPMSNAQAMTFVSYGTALPTGETLITDFSTGANLTGGTLVTGSQGGVTAAPAYSSAPTFDTAQYLSVQGGQSATLTFGATREVSVYLGSLDAYNTLSFGGPGGATFTGADLGAVSGANNGDQTGPETATFTSTSNAFEVASVASIAAVPEPASWALMLMGFGTAGAALRSSRRQRVIA